MSSFSLGVVDAVVPEPVVERLELLGAAEEPEVELVDLAGGPSHEPMVTLRREEEPDHRQVEDHGEDEQLVGIELPAAIAVPRPFDGRHAGLGEAGAEVALEPLGELLLRPSP